MIGEVIILLERKIIKINFKIYNIILIKIEK